MNRLQPALLATDLEGILLPEIWIAVAEKTGIEELRLTTRDVADYDELMRMRINTLRRHNLKITDIQTVIGTMDPLSGASDFLQWARSRVPVIVITDSFYEMVNPFLPKLGYVTVFAHRLEVSASGYLTGYRLRVPDGKVKALQAMRQVGFNTVAVGDSYNDVGMLQEADAGILFRPPTNVASEFPQFPVVSTYSDLTATIDELLELMSA